MSGLRSELIRDERNASAIHASAIRSIPAIKKIAVADEFKHIDRVRLLDHSVRWQQVFLQVSGGNSNTTKNVC